MAKAKKSKSEPVNDPLLDPEALHKLVGAYDPYEPPPPPIPTKGYVTWWDAGSSVNTLAMRYPKIFWIPRLFAGERCCKDTDSWRWRQWKVEPIAPNLPFEQQQKQLKNGDEPATVRELVMYFALVFLTTSEKLDLGRLRCKDVAESGQRMTVWFSPCGIDIASVSDAWKSPGIGLAVVNTPKGSPKRR
jgi:hypothetical protein